MKFDPPVEMTTIKVQDAVSGYFKGEDAQNNDVYRLIEKSAGIKVTNKFTVAGDAYEEKMKVAIAKLRRMLIPDE